jgi:hypothetical protein
MAGAGDFQPGLSRLRERKRHTRLAALRPQMLVLLASELIAQTNAPIEHGHPVDELKEQRAGVFSPVHVVPISGESSSAWPARRKCQDGRCRYLKSVAVS